METNVNSSGTVIKELFKSLAILFALTLVYGFFGLCHIFSITNNFCYGSSDLVSLVVGPLILIVFIIRGIRFHKRGKTKVTIISIAIPLLIYLFASLYAGSDALGGRILNVFYPYSSIVANKVQIDAFEKIASETEINPTEICATRDSGRIFGAGSDQSWVYDWVIEWSGSIKFPQGSIPVSYTQISNNGPLPGTLLGHPFVETDNSGYTFVNNFQSDGEFHEWRISYPVNPSVDFDLYYYTPSSPKTPLLKDVPTDAEYEIQFRSFDEWKRVYGKTYYKIIVPELVTQKLFSLGKTQEQYTRELTESERLVGAVCVTLKQ